MPAHAKSRGCVPPATGIPEMAALLSRFLQQILSESDRPRNPATVHAETQRKRPGRWSAIFNRLRETVRLRNYSKKTFRTYASWINRFAWFVKHKDPDDVVIDDVKNFLTDLAVNRNVAATTQNQAFNALLFLFRHIFGRPDDFDVKSGVVRAKSKKYIPVVLSRQEIDQIISKMRQPYSLVLKLLYGCGLRLFEALNLRIQCFDFSENILTVHDGKGLKDRTLPIPETVLPELQAHIEKLKALHNEDIEQKYLGVFMPYSAIGERQILPWQTNITFKRLKYIKNAL